MAVFHEIEQTEVSFRELFQKWVNIRNFPSVVDLVFFDRWDAIRQGQAISIEDFVEVVSNHFQHNGKTKDHDKIFPRESRISALADELRNPGTTTKPEGFDKKLESGNEQWKFYVKKNFQLSSNPSQSAIGINQFGNCLYQIMTEKEQRELLKSWHKSGRDEPYYQAPVTPLENAYVDYIKAHIRGSAENHGHRGRDDTFEQMKLGLSSSFKKDLLRKLSDRCPSCMPRVEKAIEAAKKAEPEREKARKEKKRKAGMDYVADDDDDDDYMQASPSKKRDCKDKRSTPPKLLQLNIQAYNPYFNARQMFQNSFDNSNVQLDQTAFQQLTSGQGKWANSDIPTNNAVNLYDNANSASWGGLYRGNNILDNQHDDLSAIRQFNATHEYPNNIDPNLLVYNRIASNSAHQCFPAAQPLVSRVDASHHSATLDDVNEEDESDGMPAKWVYEDCYPPDPYGLLDSTSKTQPELKLAPKPSTYHESDEHAVKGLNDMARFNDDFFGLSSADNDDQQMEAEQATEPQLELNDGSTDYSPLFEATDLIDFDKLFGESDPDSPDAEVQSPDVSTTVSQQPSVVIDPALTPEAEAEVETISPNTDRATHPGQTTTPYHLRRSWWNSYKPRGGTNLTLPQIPSGSSSNQS
jgi:hypothetical protein